MTDIAMLIQKVSPIAEKYGVERVKLFGSRARGDDKPQSDYDFLISKGKIRSLIQYCGFINELEDVLERHVDVITDTSDDQYIINIAENEGINIYGKNKA